MNKQEMLEYVRTSLEKGEKIENIKQTLIKEGWSLNEVENTLTSILNEYITLNADQLKVKGFVLDEFNEDISYYKNEDKFDFDIPDANFSLDSYDSNSQEDLSRNLHKFSDVKNEKIEIPKTIGKIIYSSGLPAKSINEIQKESASVEILTAAKERIDTSDKITKASYEKFKKCISQLFNLLSKFKKLILSPIVLGIFGCIASIVPFIGSLLAVSGIYRSISTPTLKKNYRIFSVGLNALAIFLSLINGVDMFYQNSPTTFKQSMEVGLLGVFANSTKTEEKVMNDIDKSNKTSSQSENIKLSFKLPDAWNIYYDGDEHQAIILFNKEADTDKRGKKYIATISLIEREVEIGELSLAKYGQELKKSSFAVFDKYQPLIEEIQFFENVPVYYLRGRLYDRDYKLSNEQFAFILNRNVYIITGTYLADIPKESQRMKEVRGIVNDIITQKISL
jgi:hypothetical protein